MITHCPVCHDELTYSPRTEEFYSSGISISLASLRCKKRENTFQHFSFFMDDKTVYNPFYSRFTISLLTPEQKAACLDVQFDPNDKIICSLFDLRNFEDEDKQNHVRNYMSIVFSSFEEFVNFSYSVSNGTNPNILFL